MLKFTKKYKYDDYMDIEVVDLCNAMKCSSRNKNL